MEPQGALRRPLTSMNASGLNSRKSLIPGPAGRKSLLPADRPSVGGPRPSIGGPATNNRASFARQSGAGVRTSSIYGKGKTTKSDPRPLSSKEHIASSARAIINYLVTHSFDRQLSTKQLLKPTSNDFFAMMAFLWNRIDSNYQLQKPEEEIPFIFKGLRYPFNISKSILQAVGTPHTWPTLLGAMTWLVELLSYEEVAEAESKGSTMDTATEDRKFFFEFLCKAYREFLKGLDDFEEMEKELERNFDLRNAEKLHEIKRIESSIDATQREIEKLNSDKNNVASLKEERNTLISDLNKFKKLIENLVEHKAASEKKYKEHQKEYETKQLEIESIGKEKVQLQEILKQQQQKDIDVSKLNSERSSLEAQLASFAQQRDAVEKVIYEKEMKISKKISDVDAAILGFNNKARQNQLIPSTARYARGADFQIRFTHHSPESNIEEIKKITKPALEQLKEELSKATVASQGELLTLQDKIDRTEENIADKKDEIASIQLQIQRLEAEYKKEKQRRKDEVRRIELETENVRKEIAAMKEMSAESLKKSEKSLEELTKEFQALEQKFAEEELDLSKTLVQVLDSLDSHKSFISDNIAALHKLYSQTRDNLSVINPNKTPNK